MRGFQTLPLQLMVMFTIVVAVIVTYGTLSKYGIELNMFKPGGSGNNPPDGNAYVSTGVTVTEVARESQQVLEAIEHANSQGGVENRKCSCGSYCSDYTAWLVKYSNEYGIPDPLLPLSMMMQESGCNLRPSDGQVCNDYGYCGLMQISETVPGYSDPETNIREGIKHLREKYDRYKDGKTADGCLKALEYYGWEAAVRGYVGWGCNAEWLEEYKRNPGNEENVNIMKGHDDYVESVMLRYAKLKDAV